MQPNYNNQQFPSKLDATTIYVGNLHKSVTEQDLFNLFYKCGQIFSLAIMRDIETQESRCFGFVTFHNPRDAYCALQSKQYEIINGQAIRIMFKQQINQSANVVVKNLDKSINERQLHEFFSEMGHVLSVYIRRFNLLSMGYVSFSHESEAELAVKELNEKKLGENFIIVEKFNPENKKSSKKNIYLRNLHFDTEEDASKWIVETFEKFGEISTYKAFIYKPKIFSAYISFKNDKNAELAFESFTSSPPLFTNGERAVIAWHHNKVERFNSLAPNNIFLKNLSLETTVDQVRNIFEQFGKIESVSLSVWESKDKKKKAKFGFILFSDRISAQEALNKYLRLSELQKLAVSDSKIEVHPFQMKKDRLLKMRKFKESMAMTRAQRQRGMAFFKPPAVSNMNYVRGQSRNSTQQTQQNPRIQYIVKEQTPKPQTKPTTETLKVNSKTLRMKLDELKKLGQEEKRSILGHFLYKRVQEKIGVDIAPKVTGMLLELDVEEIIELIEDDNSLEERLDEAKKILSEDESAAKSE